MQPKGKKKGCGGFGQTLMVVIAVVVSIYTAGATVPLFGGTAAAGGTFATGLAALGGGAGLGAAGVVAVGAVAGATGSIVSQAVGVAVGIQEKFSWNAVALAAIGGGASGGLAHGSSILSGGGPWMAAARGAAGNTITQGIGVATGQKEFSWAGVAAASVGAAAFQFASTHLPGAATATTGATFGNRIGASTASAIADAGTRGRGL